jgi:subtilisin family serine protease
MIASTRCLVAGAGMWLCLSGCASDPTPLEAPQAQSEPPSASVAGTTDINVLLRGPATSADRSELSRYGAIYAELAQINAVLMRASADDIPRIRALPFVASVGRDQPRDVPPEENVAAEGFIPLAPHNVWNLDALNVTDFDPSFSGAAQRQVAYDGKGVVVTFLDTGLMPLWPFYFAGKDVDTQHSTTLMGGGESGNGTVVSPKDKWERDVLGHGTHVSSVVLGYRYVSGFAGSFQVDGIAPAATLVMIKVANQRFGQSSAIAQGVVYATDLVRAGGPHAGKRMVINMSLGGPELDPVERAAFDYAVQNGVVLVAAAGNSGPTGNLIYPAAYEPVISAAAAGWVGEWDDPGGNNPPNPACGTLPLASDLLQPLAFWRQCDVPDPYASANFFIAPFSSRDPDGLDTGANYDLDVAAPGDGIIGPWGSNNGQISYRATAGTSEASPHVSGIVALMLQKNPGITPAQVESCLESAAQPLIYSGQQARPYSPNLTPEPPVTIPSWGSDRSGHGFITADAALACA